MAATGTPTTNIGLRRPQGTDPASVDDINYNSQRIDAVFGAIGNTSVKAQLNALDDKIGQFTDAGVYTVPKSGSITLEISNSTTIFLCISHNGNGTAFLGMWLISVGTGQSSVNNILPSSVISVTSSGNKQMTVSNSNANYDSNFSMFRVYGNATVTDVT